MKLAHEYMRQQREKRQGQPAEQPEKQQPEQPTPRDLQPVADRLGIKPEHIKHYADALIRWRAAGYPTRTQPEVEACLAVCVACEHYTKNGKCRKCGCCVNNSKIAALNKAKMLTEQCPKGKWLL